MKRRYLIAALCALCLTSCASSDKITQAKVQQIQPGVTTEADLLQIFGRPDTKLVAFSGEATLDWFRSVGPNPAGYLPLVGQFAGGLDLDVQQLSVIIGPSGRVRSFTVYDSLGVVKSERLRLRTVSETGYRK